MNETTSKTRPRVAILWNGVTLEELGIADLLKSADLTLTIGRTNPSKKLPTGKPKVGGATVTFLLPNEKAAKKIFDLLYANPRPMLTMGFGYHGAQSYWLGEAGIRTRPDAKQFATVRGYKIDNVTWDYSASFPTVTLNGMAGHTLGLTESRKPKSWAGKTLADIAKDISEQHGITVRISGKVPANVRMDNAVQYVGESTLDAMDRLTRLHGGTLHLSTMVTSAVPGASKAYDYTFEGRPPTDDDSWAEDQAQIRTILTIKAIEEEFVDLDSLEQATIPIIAWAPHLSPGKFNFYGGRLRRDPADGDASYLSTPHHTAISIKAVEENIARSYHAAGGVTKNAKAQKAEAAVREFTATPYAPDRNLETAQGLLVFAPDDSPTPGPTTTPAVQRQALSSAPESMGGKSTTTASVAAAAYASGIKTRLTIELNPGAPELSTGVEVEVRGTYTHDGNYGVEECRNVVDASGGLKTSLTVRSLLPGGSDRGKNAKNAKNAKKPDVPQEFTAAPYSPNRNLEVAPGRLVFVTDDAVPALPPVTSDAVPSAPDGVDPTEQP